jgi:hypothetical protein
VEEETTEKTAGAKSYPIVSVEEFEKESILDLNENMD